MIEVFLSTINRVFRKYHYTLKNLTMVSEKKNFGNTIEKKKNTPKILGLWRQLTTIFQIYFFEIFLSFLFKIFFLFYRKYSKSDCKDLKNDCKYLKSDCRHLENDQKLLKIVKLLYSNSQCRVSKIS